MPEAFRKLNCKLCKSGFERTHQILKVMLPKFMWIQRFHCKLCETKFAKGHWWKDILFQFISRQRILFESCETGFATSCKMKIHEEAKNFIANCVKLLLEQHIIRWKYILLQFMMEEMQILFAKNYTSGQCRDFLVWQM